MWDYTEKVMDHFLEPKNVGEVKDADAVGDVGNMTCGDALKLTLKIEDDKIVDAKFKTFGCASAIASSSALTEIVKGMTIEEASKITNQDIVDILGELPEEKMHCSVMGMEALQAAIADYRGEAAPADDDDHEGRIVCTCFGVTDVKIRKVAKENKLHDAEEVTNYCKAGGGCGGCLDDIQSILDGIWREEAEAPASTGGGMSIVQKVMKIQEVLDKEITPLLEQDGGGIELIDVIGDVVKVRLQGRCAVCPTSHITMKHTVQDKLREFVLPSIEVEEVK
jgi:NifU-like protein